MRHAAVELRRLSPRDTVTGGDPGSSLAGINTAMLPDGCVCWVAATKRDYQLDKDSVVAADGVSVIAANGPGRWLVLTLSASVVGRFDWRSTAASPPGAGATLIAVLAGSLSTTPKLYDFDITIFADDGVDTSVWLGHGSVRSDASGNPTALLSAVDLREQTAGAAAWGPPVLSLAAGQLQVAGANATAGTVWSADVELRRAA